MSRYNSKLYVGTYNIFGGTGVYSYNGTAWNLENNTGFSPLNDYWDCSSMLSTNPSLYVGALSNMWGCGIERTQTGAASITSVNPSKGERGQTLDVAITGNKTNFAAGISSALFSGTGITVNSTKVTDATHVTANITIGTNAPATKRDVEVQTDYESPALVDGFTVTVPTITSISPTAGEAGTTEVTIKGTGFGAARGTSSVSFGTAKVTGYTSWSDTEIKCTAPSGISGKVDVTVTTDTGTSNSKTFTVTTPTWFLAEGSTDWGFDCYISIENPNPTAVTAQVGYMTDAGLVTGPEVSLPANSQATVNPRDTLGDKDFSTQVECKEGKTIAVDRTMSWTGEGAPSPDGHCSIGVTSADTTWYLAEGSSAWGFECWLLIQNPNPNEATCQVTYMIEGDAPQTFEKKVPAQSRKTYNMANDIGEKDASIKVTADMPVIPERAMYRNNRRSGHDSIGTTSPANDYYLAEGTTDWGFTTYVLVQNPNEDDTDVTVTYMTNSGPVPQGLFTMPENSRKTIRVNDVMPGADFSTQVSGTRPIIAERAMYWGEGTALGEASHDSIGLAAPHTTFYLPDGETSNGRETYTLVMNPNNTNVTVEVSYLTPDGKGNVTFTETVGANSRKTFSMVDKGINGRAAVMVTCKTAGKKIMVERAMYWNTRGAGTDTIGGYGD